jgi:hypothetical protein
MDIQEVPELKTETTNGIPEPDRAFLVVRQTFVYPRENCLGHRGPLDRITEPEAL